MENQWLWKGKPVALDKLHTKQLKSIQATLIRNKGTEWYGLASVDWRKAIKDELDRRRAVHKSNLFLNRFNTYKEWKESSSLKTPQGSAQSEFLMNKE